MHNLQKVKKPTYAIINQATGYPYTPPVNIGGISIANDGVDTVTVEVYDGENTITINCTTTNPSYDGDFRAVKTINVTAGTTFQIEMRYA